MTLRLNNRTVAAVIALTGALAATPARAQTYTCASAPAVATLLRSHALDIATDSAWADLRDSLGVTGTIDSAQVVTVTSDSLCNLVTNGVRASAQSGPAAGLVVVRAGTFYTACVPNVGFTSVYVLDDHFRLRVVVRPPD